MTSLTFRRLPALFNEMREDMREGDLFNGGTYSPDVDIVKNDKEYRLEAILPGVAKDDLHVEVKEGSLIISGKFTERTDEGYATVLSEIPAYEKFYRAFRLDENSFDADGIDG